MVEENVLQINRGITTNVEKDYIWNHCEKDYIWNPATCSCENGKYLTSIMDDSAITRHEFFEEEETKNVPTIINEKRENWKMQNLYILLAFLLITIALLIAVSIYCHLIKHRAKQKHLLPYHVINNNLKEIMY